MQANCRAKVSIVTFGLDSIFSRRMIRSVFFGEGSSGVLRARRSSGKPLGQQSPHFHFITGSILALNLVVLAPYLFVASKRKRPTRWKNA